MDKLPQSIDEYIAGFSGDVRERLLMLRETVSSAAPEAEEKISWGMPTFCLLGNLVHFAAYNNHIGLYPAPSAIARFEDELRGYHKAKGSVQFPSDKPLPYSLVAEIVRFRVEENMQAWKSKRAKRNP